MTLVLAKAVYLETVLQKESHDDFLRHLRVLRQRSGNDLQKLHSLLGDIIKNYPHLEASNSDPKVQIKFSKKGWMKYAGKARSLHGNLRESRKSIDEAMNQLSGYVIQLVGIKI